MARRPRFVLNQEQYQGANVLIGGPNFGTGSSREHAVWAIQQYGFEAVVSPRFGDIFRNNCTKNGLVPVQVSAEVGERLLRMVEADPDAGVRDRRRRSARCGPATSNASSRSTTRPSTGSSRASTTSA